jgi:hypothetical protein
LKKALVIITVLATLVVTPAGNTGNNWQWQHKKWLPPVWQRIAQCETGTNWKHNSGTYQGAFGFYHGSWDAFNKFGYPREAYNATPWQQYKVALAIYKRYGFTGWGCYMNRSWVRNGY